VKSKITDVSSFASRLISWVQLIGSFSFCGIPTLDCASYDVAVIHYLKEEVKR
jgi:hypothetical protein